MDVTQTATNTPEQSGPGSNDNKKLIRISKRSETEVWSLDGLVSYTAHSLGGLSPLQLCSLCILPPQPTVIKFICWFCEQPRVETVFFSLTAVLDENS